MKAIHKKRMQKLAEYLRTVPIHRFAMSKWATETFCGKRNEPSHNACGSTACALGWCSVAFKRSGFKLLRKGDLLGHKFDSSDYASFSWIPGDTIIPVYKDRSMFGAAEKFFGITNREATYLFGPDPERTPKEESKVLLQFLKQKEKEKV